MKNVQRTLFSNAVMVMLFFSDVNQYVPVKLWKNEESIHLFKILGHLTSDQDWKVVLVTLNGNMIHLPTSVIIPLRDNFRFRCMIRKRSLLMHIMLKQGTSWYALDNKEYLLHHLV